jgi:hypothetical protein
VVGLAEGGGPGGEELERVVGGGAGSGAVGADPQAGVGGEVKGLEGEGEISDGGVLTRVTRWFAVPPAGSHWINTVVDNMSVDW